MDEITLKAMTPEDYDRVVALWKESTGVGVTDTDSREGVEAFLERNPGLSLLAFDGNDLVGVILSGHDGRRGYMSHLAVAESHRRRGVGTALTERCVELLAEAGIDKCHVFVFRDNEQARGYWAGTGWDERGDISVFSKFILPQKKATR